MNLECFIKETSGTQFLVQAFAFAEEIQQPGTELGNDNLRYDASLPYYSCTASQQSEKVFVLQISGKRIERS